MEDHRKQKAIEIFQKLNINLPSNWETDINALAFVVNMLWAYELGNEEGFQDGQSKLLEAGYTLPEYAHHSPYHRE